VPDGRLDEMAASRRVVYPLLAALTGLPRLVALVADRGDILLPFTFGEKSDDIARTFLDSGTFGFIPGLPTAYTQPLYSFFLIPLYWVFDRSWAVVGGAQILVAIATTLVVYEIGRRWLSPVAGALGALLSTLHPYAVWHDVHVNREILDGLLAVAITYLVLALSDRRSVALAAALGAALGIAILGNVRLAALPLVLLVFLLVQWRLDRRAAASAAVVLAVCAAVVAPWVVRNHEAVGCFALTTDSRALWEANNPRTLETLRDGLWIDNVPLPPSFPPSAQDAGREYRRHGQVVRVDECRQMRFYRGEVLDFWREHPGEKVKLAGQATLMFWSPAVTPRDVRGESPGWLNRLRESAEPVYMLPLFALAVAGLWRVSRRVAVLSVVLLAYQWVMAMVFVGTTRYRVPWDFVVALLAAAAVVDLVRRVRARRAAST
jgi:4-amino-4-deoxy-L-arabinose transferase-like glycosyltransferase